MRLSADRGHTWEPVCDGLPPLSIEGKAGSWHHGRVTELAPGHLLGAFWWLDRSDPSRPMINPQTTGTLPNVVFLMDSFDDGRSWVNPRPVDTRPFPSVALMGAPLRLGDGGIPGKAGDAIAVVSEAWKTYDDPSYGEHSATLAITHDGGRSFEPSIIVAHDPANRLLFWDERLAVDPQSGRLVGMFWTHDRVTQQDANARIVWGTPDGKCWTEPTDTGFAGQIPRPLILPGGRLSWASMSIATGRRRCARCSARISGLRGMLPTSWSSTPMRPAPRPGWTANATSRTTMLICACGRSATPSRACSRMARSLIAYYAGDANSLSIRWARIEL